MTPSKLRAIRKRLGLSQKDMAGALGLTTEHINRMERGKVPIQSVYELACQSLLAASRGQEQTLE